MRRGHLNAEAPLGLLGETHSVGRGTLLILPVVTTVIHFLTSAAPSLSPERPTVNAPALPGYPYRLDHAPQQGAFDLDLHLNPDL